MAKVRHLDKAPIVEAIIEVRLDPNPDLNIEMLKAFHGEIRKEFPTAEERRLLEGKLSFDPKTIVQTSAQSVVGFSYKSEDGLNVAQFMLNSFVFSRLKPYPEWDTFYAAAKSVWEKYWTFTGKKFRIVRVGTRFINLLETPPGKIQMRKLFPTFPLAPVGNLVLSGGQVRLLVKNPVEDYTAIIGQALKPGSGGKNAAIAIDIDVFQERDFGLDAESAWDAVGRLKKFKNELFFNTVADSILKQYE